MKDKEYYQALPYAAVGAISGAWKYYKPELMWAGIGASVLAYDLKCREGGTLSESVDSAIESHPLLTRMAIGTVALHLANGFEAVGAQRFDPISRLFKAVKK